MKKIALVIIAILFTAPVMASAAGSVLVYPVITNANGGTNSAQDLFTTITYDGGAKTQSLTGVPTYNLSDASSEPTDFQVAGNPPYPYTYTLSGDCSGTVASGETKTCNIYWSDNATKPVPVAAPIVQPSAQPQQQTYQAPAPVVQAPVVQTAVQQTPAEQAEMIRLQGILIDLLNQLITILLQKLA